jgi:hypothetical protein
MVMWRGFERMMDRIVDNYFGEPVHMYPMLPATVSEEGVPDPLRKVIEIVGILVMPGASVTGEGGTIGSGMSTRIVTNDTWLSVQEDQLVKAKLETWQEGDRVYFPDRNLWFTVLYPTPSVTARPQINLARMQNQPT